MVPSQRRQVLKGKSLPLSPDRAASSDAARLCVIWVCNRAWPQAVFFFLKMLQNNRNTDKAGERQAGW